jgi:UDP-2-acetamido-3-amino-2,3-dideoxy-glucuronate N-acetyltransferase
MFPFGFGSALSGASGVGTILAADAFRATIQTRRQSTPAVVHAASTEFPPLRTRGAQLLRLPAARDTRGSLVWGQVGSPMPFEPRRFWCIHHVPPGQSRGGHGHRTLQELLVCLHGSCVVSIDDGVARDEVVLDDPELGLYIPPLFWSTQQRFSADAILLVLASETYRPDDYIRDYDEFLALTAHRQ